MMPGWQVDPDAPGGLSYYRPGDPEAAFDIEEMFRYFNWTEHPECIKAVQELSDAVEKARRWDYVHPSIAAKALKESEAEDAIKRETQR